MPFLKLILGFAPWLAFLIIAHDSLFRLKLGLVVALVLSLIMGILRLHRGIILWVGLAFFSSATVAVVFLENMWTVRYMGILSHGALAIATWYTLAVKRPFTMDYARAHTDPSIWNHPEFLRTNMIVTLVWALCFTGGALVAWIKMEWRGLPDWEYELVSYALMFFGVVFTNAYPAFVRQKRIKALDNPVE